MSSEQYRQEMVKFLRLQQLFPERGVHLRQQNWNLYIEAREAYFMELARERGMTYAPPKEPVSGVEQHRQDRRTGRQNQKESHNPQN